MTSCFILIPTVSHHGHSQKFYTNFSSGCHSDVVKVVELACKHDVVIIPFGGKSVLGKQCRLRSDAREEVSLCLHCLHSELKVENFKLDFWLYRIKNTPGPLAQLVELQSCNLTSF